MEEGDAVAPLPCRSSRRYPPTQPHAVDFGMVTVINSGLMEGSELSSKLMGRAMGLYYALASQIEKGMLMPMNLVFLKVGTMTRRLLFWGGGRWRGGLDAA